MKNILTGHQLSALDIQNNIALTANAGSGKTFVLSKRFLEIALSRNIPLRKIAAITFTEKAASELYKKIAQQVEDLIGETTDLQLIEILNRIRRNLISANISTIHSFCINLLREYPVEAELDANFTPVDPSVSGELIELSIDEIIKSELTLNESGEVKALIRLFSSRKKLSGELYEVVANRKNILEHRKLYSKSPEEIADYFYCSFQNITEKYLINKIPEYIRIIDELLSEVLTADKKNKKAMDALPHLKKLQSASGLEEIIKALTNLDSAICKQDHSLFAVLLKKYEPSAADSIFIKEFSEDLKSFLINPNHKEVEIELAKFGKNFLHIFEKILVRYEEKKRAKGFLDFEDILLCTKKLLEDENVRRSVCGKFDYIMIDEYQDTNEIQYEIFLPILDYLKRGNIFVVGDEKQSIYKFRDAELEVFNKTKLDITGTDGGKILMLPDSFRMGPEICLFTNYIFQKLFSEPNLLFNEVSHSDLVCARQDPSPNGEVQFLLEDSETEVTEADLVAKKILHLKSEGKIKWNEVAILSRKRKSFDELEEVFAANNIPYIVMGGRNFYQRQSIYDIYNYFSFLLDNNNDGALAGILRSPFFNISDSKLYEISLNKGFNFYQKLQSSADEALVSVRNKLQEINSLSKYSNAPELLRYILRSSNYIAYLSAKNNGVQEIANIDKLLNVTIDYYSQGFRTLFDYVFFLKNNIDQTEDESQALIADDSNTVKIMTIHQAKGLEFPIVFLFKCSESSQKSTVKQKSIIIDKSFGILTKVPLNNNYYENYHSAPIINISDFISLKKDNAELKRLLYVGMTRAKDSLYITACKSGSYKSDSFMGLLFKALNNIISEGNFSIEGKLKYLLKSEEQYLEIENKKEMTVSVLTDVECNILQKPESIIETKKLEIQPIVDSLKGEIISATKFSVYSHCPLKYKFTYQDGLQNLINNTALRYEDTEDRDQDLTAGAAGIKGRVIHKLLQEEKKSFGIEEVINLIRREEPSFLNPEILSSEIIEDLRKYFNSDIYKDLKENSGKHENEYEIYYRDNDYILFGIIDKLIIDKDVLTIIDYKTDDIPAEKISERAEEYLNQLKFYSYIIWNSFNRSYRVLFKIIFIRHSEKIYEKEESVSDLLLTGERIKEMVSEIREGKFNPDRSYCRKCIYSSDHVNCIKKVE